MQYQRGFVNLIIIIVAGLLVLGTGIGFRYHQDRGREQTVVQSISPVPDVLRKAEKIFYEKN